MSSDTSNKRVENYIKAHLVPYLVSQLENETLDSFDVSHSAGLDGFMSALFNIELNTKTETGSIQKRQLIAKLMKGDVAFRTKSKSYIQFANEVLVFGTILPAYQKMLTESEIPLEDKDWTPKCYFAKFGYIEGLSQAADDTDAVIVMENLKPLGYTMGPRLYLRPAELLRMCRPIGEYHAMSYAIKMREPALWASLNSQIRVLPFIDDANPNDAAENLYHTLYRVAFDRFFDYFDRKLADKTLNADNKDEADFIEAVNLLRAKYFLEPTRLLERLRVSVDEREEDKRFGVILHGDYNRNNVMFKYMKKVTKKRGKAADADNSADKDNEMDVEDIKMIDFQEMRYGTPAIDLSFFMYFNTSVELRAGMWEQMLYAYHYSMHNTVAQIATAHDIGDVVRKQVTPYGLDDFLKHFSRFAFYGVMICMHFLPWLLCSKEDCERLSYLFETDMNGDEFHKLSIEAGGDAVNFEILEIMKHAHKMGYMKIIAEL